MKTIVFLKSLVLAGQGLGFYDCPSVDVKISVLKDKNVQWLFLLGEI